MAANKNNPATEQQIVEQTGLTTIPGLPTPTPTPATEQQIAEQTGLTNILGLPNPGSVHVPTPESSSQSTRQPRPHKTGGAGNNTDNITKPSSENAYYDIVNAMGQKPEMQQSTDKSAGAGAAEGTQYSWDKMGTDQAQNQYQQEALKAKQDALANRQTIEQNALQYQQQADMMKYTNNQNAEKVGWTGGYVLDQNSQMEYLKSSIQAQMYGAMELQKYGYDSALAAARLSYDLNQKEFAHKYYQDAVNVAVTEAQLTGTYFSAETRDMMSQYSAADQELGDLKDKSIEEIDEGITNGSISLTPEQTRAYEVKKNIESWYSANGVSTTGIKTLSAWQTEQSMAQQWATQQWEMYQAALASAENKEAENSTVFIAYDKEGNPIYNGTSVKTLDFKAMTAEQIKEYADSTNQIGKEQVYGYVDNTFESTILNYVNSATKVKKSDGTEIVKINKEELMKALSSDSKIQGLKDILPGYSYKTAAGNSVVTITAASNGELNIHISDSESTSLIQDNSPLTPYQKDTDGSTITTWDANGSKYNYTFSGTGDNYNINYNNKDYSVTIVWSNYSSIHSANGLEKKDVKEANESLKEQYSNASDGKIAYYNNNYWIYNGDTKSWGLIVTGDSQDKDASQGEDLIKALIGR